MEIRIAVQNDGPVTGLFLTPFWFGLHDEDFNLFDIGEAASDGLEAIAEDGTFEAIAAEFSAAQPEGLAGVITGTFAGPISTVDGGASIVEVDPASQSFLSFAAMILPSNDAFIGSVDPVELFDEDGNFLGEQTIAFFGEDVYDAGTELNTELDAAFINQSAPDTGVTTAEPITQHPGFNGSVGNPEGEGDQIILGGNNAFGAFIDAVLADFTLPGTAVATVHVNAVATFDGSLVGDVFIGGKADDIVSGAGGDDVLRGRSGWDEIDGGAGEDRVFGNAGNDIVYGGDGDDRVVGGRGDDLVAGGAGDDRLVGNVGDDVFLFDGGSDAIADFGRGDDVIAIAVEGFDDFADLLGGVSIGLDGIAFDFGEAGDLLVEAGFLDGLSADDFVFV